MRGILLNRLHHCSLFVGLIFLFILPSETHEHLEGYTFKVDHNEHLNLLFAKYKDGNTICDRDLDHLISDMRKPEKKVGAFYSCVF